jgi:ubiquinone/menaquinone biosynthesis C-methylase UbiE
MPDPRPARVKDELRAFYRSEAADRDTEAWLAAGGTARVPESKAAHYFVGRKVDAAVRMAGLPAGARVLEVGCSFGQMTFLLTERYAHVTAVDLSPDALDLARRRAERYGVGNVAFQEADAEALAGLPDGAFDGAFSFSVLRYVPDAQGALVALHRTLRPGGVAVVDFPNRHNPWFGPIKSLLRIRPHIHDHLYTAREAAAMMTRAGFADVRVETLLFTTRRLPDPLLPVFRAADAVLERTPGVRRLAAILMVAGRKP